MTSHTMAEKILLNHTDKKSIEPGEIIEASIDIAMSHEMMGSRVLPHLAEAKVKKLWDPSKVVLILDHWVPPPTVEAATIHQRVRSFVKEHKIEHFYDVGSGICHQVLVEEGHRHADVADVLGGVQDAAGDGHRGVVDVAPTRVRIHADVVPEPEIPVDPGRGAAVDGAVVEGHVAQVDVEPQR